MRERVNALMRHHDGLGGARRARGVDHVGRVRGSQSSQAVGVGQWLVAQHLRLALVEPVHSWLQPTESQVDGCEHLLPTKCRVARIHWHECAACLHHRPQGNDVLGRALEREGDERFRPDAVTDQQPRDPVRAAIELGVGQRLQTVDGNGIARNACSAAQYVQQCAVQRR